MWLGAVFPCLGSSYLQFNCFSVCEMLSCWKLCGVWLGVGNCRASFPAKLLAHDFRGLLLDAPHLWSLSIRLVASSLLSLEGGWAALHAFYFSVLTPPLCCLTLLFRNFQALLPTCLWAESRNSLIRSVSEQTIWTMRKERNIFLQLGFHGILGKLLLNFEVLSFQDLLALREK